MEMHAGHQKAQLALVNVPAVSVCASSAESRGRFWATISVIQQAAATLGCPVFVEVEAGYVWILYCVYLGKYILCVRCKIMLYSPAAGTLKWQLNR